ncbi:YrrS family protein [Ferdinandcohnia sp. Marseille-Q9671]
MGYDLDKFNEGPRSERRAKRKKVNRILNVLIGLVIILIVFFGGKLIFGDKNVEDTVSSNQSNQPKDNKSTAPDEKEDKTKEEEQTTTEKSDKDKEQENEKDKDDKTAPKSEEAAVVTEGDPNSNVAKVIENPAWKPIGTEQTEPHSIVYDEGSTDRNEMEMAASYATGFDRSDMVVWWLGRNGENSITATVSSKTTKQVQRVYLDWVPNEGWKPVKIEELKENEYNKKKSEQDEDENEMDEDEPDENED